MDAELFANHILGESVSATVAGSLLKALPAEGAPEIRLFHRLPAAIAETPEAERVVLKNARDWGKVRDLRTLNLLEAGREGKNSLYAITEYHQGRLLSDILDRLRHEGLPLAPDQAVYLAERIAGALLSLAEQGITVGGLSPDRVSVSFEGEVKLLPALLKDLQTTPLLKDPTFDAYWRYLPPAHAGGKSAKASADIYSVGALLFEFLCREPFRPAPSEPFDPASRLEEGRRGLDGADPLPDNLHRILKRSLIQDASEAYGDLKVLKADLDQLITSGEYSPTTFNIAFLMHSLYRGEDEAEDSADKAFASLDRTPFRREATPPAPPAPPASSPAPAPSDLPSSFTQPSDEPAESPLASRKNLLVGAGIAAAVVLLAIVFALRPKGPSEEQIRAQQQMADLEKERAQFKAQQEAMAAKLKALEDEKAALQEQVNKATTADEKVRAQKALEETQSRLRAQQEEQKRLAAEKVNPPATTPAPSAPPAPSEPSAPAASAPPTAEAALSSALEAPPAAAPASPPVAKVQAGDFVELWAVDIKPKQTNQLSLDVTSPARQNRLKGTFFVEVSVDETGAVTDARVVRGPVPDYGMNDACRRACMKLRYSPALKDGVPVKTKVTFPIVMK